MLMGQKVLDFFYSADTKKIQLQKVTGQDRTFYYTRFITHIFDVINTLCLLLSRLQSNNRHL